MGRDDSWKCSCKGSCAPSAMNRRSFLKTTAMAAGAASLATGATPSHGEETVSNLSSWTQSLMERGSRRQYRGEELDNIAMPLGGIGAGQVYLQGNGRLGPWQIVNNFCGTAFAEGSFFGLWSRQAGQTPQAVLLQREGMRSAPGVNNLVFEGEYPFAWITYDLPGFPIQATLEAYSPMIPLNEEDSGLPGVVFRFTLKNMTQTALEVSLLASTPNLVGWEGYTALESRHHEDFTGAVNLVEQDTGATHVVMRAVSGSGACLGKSCAVATHLPSVAQSLRFCGNVTVKYDAGLPRSDAGTPAVYWLGDFETVPSESQLQQILSRVSEDGASLILSGMHQGPLAYSINPDKKPEKGLLFEDWESGTYDAWTITGDTFGPEPSTGTAPGQQTVSGFRGQRFVNTFAPKGDDGTGRAQSKPFKVKNNFIHFLAGGGNHPGETCFNLLVDGQAVFSVTGRNEEKIVPMCWDVSEFRGKVARFEIVDTRQDGWGHILIDDIQFSDSPHSPFLGAQQAGALYEAFPFRYSKVRAVNDGGQVYGGPLHESLENLQLHVGPCWEFKRLKLRENAHVLLETENGIPLVIRGTYGKGTVLFCNGRPETWSNAHDRKTVLGALAGLALDTPYTVATGLPENHPCFGSMTLSALHDDCCAQPQWGHWETLWKEFSANGRLRAGESRPSAAGRTWNAAIATPLSLRPGEWREVRFVLTWHFPNRTRNDRYGWGPKAFQYDHRLGNHYNKHFADAPAVARYIATHLDRLERTTRTFHGALYDTTLPHWFIDCVSANASITRSPIYVWLEDGTVGGFEGSDSCCPMNCTHVYNYAMSMAYLYPALERNIRETDLLRQMHPEGHYIPHRTVLPLSQPRLENDIGGPHHHALDGELGTLLKMYREWRMYGNRRWLRALWPKAKMVMEHVLRDHDTDNNGVLRGEQPNTYDTHLFGSNTFIGTLYLAALRAMEEMAKLMGDTSFAAQCQARFEQGSAEYDRRCWNGEYYVNVFDAPDADPTIYNDNNCYGPGCHADQLLGQWWAHLLGLGYVLPREHVESALKAIHKYSWRENFVGHVQQPRRFADDNERGLLICTWPKGGRPEKPILYSDEIWTGIEYSVAASMIYEGLIEPAFQIVRAARDRYTGARRNPWSEIECGGHYARAMSSYSLLHAAAGLNYDAGLQSLQIRPRITPDDFRCFFTTAQGWGNVAMRHEGRRHGVTIDIKHGMLGLRRITIPAVQGDIEELTISDQPHFAVHQNSNLLQIDFRKEQMILPGHPLEVAWRE